MSPYRIDATSDANQDIEGAYWWYEAEEPGLGLEFLDELRVAYRKIADGPHRYQELRSGIRRALTTRFPYAIYFYVDGDVVIVLAVLHAARNPAEWQRRI